MKVSNLQISGIACLEIQNIITGVFNPLKGFMTSNDYNSVVTDMHLSSGEAWTIPVSLEFPENKLDEFRKADKLELFNQQNENIATMRVEDIFEVNYENDIKYVFGTDDKKHPGIAYELSKSKFRVGGEIISATKDNNRFLGLENTPDEIKKVFKEKNGRQL